MRDAQKQIILLGAGGHALVLKALAEAAGMTIAAVADPTLHKAGHKRWNNLPVLNDEDVLLRINPAETALINGIGQLPRSLVRKNIQMKFMDAGFGFPPCIHPAAWISADTVLAPGCQIMAGAIVQPNCRIGIGSILNTKVSIDHECSIADHVHIAPGATLCGNVTVGEGAFIGSGATIVQNLKIGAAAILAAGTTLRQNQEAGSVFRG